MGMKWPHAVVSAARARQCLVFVMQMEKDAHVDMVTFGERALRYWEDPDGAMTELIGVLGVSHPPHVASTPPTPGPDIESARERYRALVLGAVDIIDLANLPEMDRHVATRQLELRRLYVPLRLRTESGVGEEIEDAKLRELEERRGEEPVREAAAPERVPVGERLQASQRLVILGDPGSGKTTLVRWLATAYLLRLHSDPEHAALPDVSTLPNRDLLPIVVRCRDLDANAVGGSLDDFLQRTFRKSEMTQSEADALLVAFRQDLRDGNALLLVDGLDEIQDPSQRVRFCNQLEQIHLAYPDAWIVVTSRIVGYREMGIRIGRGFEHATIADLSADDKNDFARRWCELTEPAERRATATAELIEDIHSANRIERLTGNPMLLTTMALVKRKVGKLPSGRAELYADAVDVLLRWRHEVDEPIDHREALPQLQYVAYAMCARGEQHLREDEILELLETMREEYPRIRPLANHSPAEFLDLLERRTGMLIQAGHVRDRGELQPVYEFRHLTFQEYLAAVGLVKGRYPQRDPNVSLADALAPLAGLTSDTDGGSDEPGIAENWREVIRLCVALCNDDDVDAAVEAVMTPLDAEEPAVARPRAVLATQCLTDEPNVSDEVSRRVLDNLASHIDIRDGSERRASAIDAVVSALGGSPWAETLAEVLRDEFDRRPLPDRIRVGLVFATATAKRLPADHEGLTAWIEDLAGELDGDGKDRLTAALRLASLESPYASRARFRVPVILSSRPELLARTTSRLLDAVSGDTPMATASLLALAAVRSLAFEAWREPLHPLADLLASPGLHQEHFLLALSAIDPVAANDAKSAIVAGLEHEDPHIRRAALSIVPYLDSHDFGPQLRRLARDPDPGLRATAVTELSEADLDDELVSALLEDESGTVQYHAYRMLHSMASSSAKATLESELRSRDPERRILAARTLPSGPVTPEALATLVAMADDGSIEERRTAVRTLSRVPDREAGEALARLCRDEEPAVRVAVAHALADRDESAEAPLVALAQDPDGGVRAVAVSRLQAIVGDESLEMLVKCLEDPYESVRANAALSLILRKDSDRSGADAAIAYLRACGESIEYVSIPYKLPEHSVESFLSSLDGFSATLRGEILGSAARSLGLDDLTLLSLDLDGVTPYWDPHEPIGAQRIADVAAALGRTHDEVREEYAMLAKRLPIRLVAELA